MSKKTYGMSANFGFYNKKTKPYTILLYNIKYENGDFFRNHCWIIVGDYIIAETML